LKEITRSFKKHEIALQELGRKQLEFELLKKKWMRNFRSHPVETDSKISKRR